jgi:hypothetical protein
VDLPDHVLPDVVREPTEERRNEEADLRRPCRRVRPHRQDAVVERLRAAVVRDLVSDHLPPASDDGTDRDVLGPPEIAQQERERRGDQLRIPTVASRRAARGIER